MDRKEKYKLAKEKGLDIKWTMKTSEMEAILEDAGFCIECGSKKDGGYCPVCETKDEVSHEEEEIVDEHEEEEEKEIEIEFIDDEEEEEVPISSLKPLPKRPVKKPLKRPVNRNQQYLQKYFPAPKMPKASNILGKKKKRKK